jgi:AbrB family looped-hinge helix DNA binding protein
MPVLSATRRVTVPKKLCDRLGLVPGDMLDLGESDGRITLVKRAEKRVARTSARVVGRASERHTTAKAGKEVASVRAPSHAAPLNVSGAGLRTYLQIANAWKLSEAEQRRLLGDPSPATFARWKRDPAKLSRDALKRISYVLGIFGALGILFPEPARAHAWIRRSNNAPSFGGRSALSRMLSGNVSDLYDVRRYLEGQLAG